MREYKHGETATCMHCGEVITRRLDRANPYWEHPNRYPNCRDSAGEIQRPEPTG